MDVFERCHTWVAAGMCGAVSNSFYLYLVYGCVFERCPTWVAAGICGAVSNRFYLYLVCGCV